MMHSVPEHEAVVLKGVHAAPQQERYGKIAYMHSIQGKMRKRAIVVIRQPTIPVTDRYRLFLMRLGGAQPLLLILLWTPGAQGVMGAFLVLPPYPLPKVLSG
jgi:hypothetical protein